MTQISIHYLVVIKVELIGQATHLPLKQVDTLWTISLVKW